MAEASFSNFFNSVQTFGLNVRTKERALQQVGDTLVHTATGVFEPLVGYLEENENVFSGNITHELNKCYAERFTMNAILNAEDEKVNGAKPKFDAKF